MNSTKNAFRACACITKRWYASSIDSHLVCDWQAIQLTGSMWYRLSVFITSIASQFREQLLCCCCVLLFSPILQMKTWLMFHYHSIVCGVGTIATALWLVRRSAAGRRADDGQNCSRITAKLVAEPNCVFASPHRGRVHLFIMQLGIVYMVFSLSRHLVGIIFCLFFCFSFCVGQWPLFARFAEMHFDCMPISPNKIRVNWFFAAIGPCVREKMGWVAPQEVIRGDQEALIMILVFLFNYHHFMHDIIIIWQFGHIFACRIIRVSFFHADQPDLNCHGKIAMHHFGDVGRKGFFRLGGYVCWIVRAELEPLECEPACK